LPPFHILNIGASGRSVAVGKKSSDDGKLEIAMPAIMDEYLLNAGPQLNQGAITSTSTGYIALARFDFTNISGQAKPIGFCVSVDDDRIYRFILNATKSSSNVMSIRSFFELDSYDETTNFWAYPTGKYVYIYGSKDSSAGVFAVHNLIYDQTDQSLVVTYPGTVTTTKGSTWKQAACWWYDASTASRGLLNSTDKSKLNAQSSNGVTPWKMVAEGTSASGYTEYPTVDLSEFSEFLLTCNASSGYRVYASITITKEYYTGSYGKDSDKTQGMHVAFYDTNYYVGVSFIDKENVKLYFGPKQVYAALYAR
jgi:hypothetical protein